jgi:uncharacterized protein YecE (DUF72 family)
MNRVHVGTMGWSYDFWRGSLYPKDMKSKNFLAEYSKHFNTVEIDNTFYKIPSEATVTNWKDQTPTGFLFSAKFPGIVTHVKMLKDCENEVERFTQRISRLQDKLGPLLLQFPRNFDPKHAEALNSFLPSLPKGFRFALEVRNSKLLNEKLYSVLRENGVALATVDGPSVPKADVTTADFAYIRWEGDRRKVKGTLGTVEVDRTADIRKWAEKVNTLSERGEVFGYFSKYYSGHPPTDIHQLLGFLQ